MLIELVIAAVMVLLTVAIHGLGLAALVRLLRLEAQEEEAHRASPFASRSMVMMLAIVIGLFVLHGVEIWLYAGLYHALGAVADLRTAVYFSTITYGAIGYSDAAILPDWQLVAAIEGINGVLLIGWSTAFFVRVIGLMSRR
ncbi:MAG: ion channel [Sphingomonas sp.]